jgi:hypothetical protein
MLYIITAIKSTKVEREEHAKRLVETPETLAAAAAAAAVE